MEDRKIEQPIPAGVLKQMGFHSTSVKESQDKYADEQSCILKNPIARAWRATVGNCERGAPLALVHQAFHYKIRNGKVIATVKAENGVTLRVWDGDWIVYHNSGHILVLTDTTFHRLYDITRFR